MTYYNADGSSGGMCGNGERCVALYTANHGIAPSTQQFEALDYVYEAVLVDSQVILSMKDSTEFIANLVLRIGTKQIQTSFVNTGSPQGSPVGQIIG